MAEPRDDELRARYRELATEEPSAALDAAIRAAARRAVGSGPAVIARPRPMRWAVPASVAAVLFLSFGVVIRMEQEVPPLELPSAPPEAPAALRKEAAMPEARLTAGKEPAARDGIADARTSAPAKPPVDLDRLKMSRQEAAPESRPEVARSPSVAQLAQAPAQEPVEAKAKISPIKPIIVTPPATPEAATVPAAAAPARPAPQAGALAPEPRAFSDSVRAMTEEKRNVESRARRDEAVGAAGLAAQAPRAKTEAFGAPHGAATTSAPAFEREAPWPDTIDKKLERIEALRKAGRDREADEAIERFRREHPDYRMPEAVWERIRPR